MDRDKRSKKQTCFTTETVRIHHDQSKSYKPLLQNLFSNYLVITMCVQSESLDVKTHPEAKPN